MTTSGHLIDILDRSVISPDSSEVIALFGRKPHSDPAPAEEEVSEAPADPRQKSAPTPSRKEAEEARKLRAKPPRTRREKAEAMRKVRAEDSHKMRDAMKTGDERYLPPRDKGPVRRFIRDWIDAKFTLGEMLIPILIIAMVLGFVGSPQLAAMGSMLTIAILLMTILNVVLLRFTLRRELRHRFPDEAPYKGTTMYAVMRSMQVRFLRLPKPQVKIGQPLSDDYR